MNERIQQLMDKSFTDHQGEQFDAEQFAEFIIRDCYSVIIKSQRGHFNPATSWDAVKEHFGIEE